MNKTNYAKEKKGKRKITPLVALFVCLASLIVGVVFAYYSDYLRETGELSSSTLKINGTYTYLLNGEQTQLDSLKNLNPGDVIVVKGTITNSGNQSAWIREKIIFGSADETLLDYLSVYNGEFAQTDFKSGAGMTEYLLPVSEGISVSGNKVINGSGSNAQTESGGNFTYLNSNTYDFVLTLYFKHSAPNSTQGRIFGFTVETQALQFRNNESEPDETAWAAVELSQ